MQNVLRTKGRKIVDSKGKPVFLRGVNLGGWLMMEAYILHAPNHAEQSFRKGFSKALGGKVLDKFDEDYREHFIKEKDIQKISKLGFNCIRVPFHHRLIEKSPFQYDKKGVAYLDRVLKWGKKYKVWVILDLHAAPGCQNHDWHSDSSGSAKLWSSQTYQRRTFALWEFLADRYRDTEYLVGYDLLNEAVIHDARILNQFYGRLIKRIRKIDQKHILFIEGNNWAMDLDCLNEIQDDNYVLSMHFYHPLEFTFNFIPFLKYPLRGGGWKWDRLTMKGLLEKYNKISKKKSVPIFCGEFGVNYRCGYSQEQLWLEDTLKLFKQYGFHWTYWTYKAVKNSIFPDGLCSYYENPPWVNRAGPLTGWETYKVQWKENRNAMIHSWETSSFEENTLVLKALRKYAK